MTLSAEDYKTLLLADIKDDGTVEAVLDSIWTLYEYEAQPLQYLRSKLHGIEDLMASVRTTAVDFSNAGGKRVNLSDMMKNLQAMHAAVEAQIQLFLAVYAGMPVTGNLTHTQLEPAAPGFPDPTSPYYKGDPNYRWWFTWRGWP